MLSECHHNCQTLTSDAGDNHFSFPYDLDYLTWAENIVKSNHNSFGRRTDANPKLGPWVGIPVARPLTPRGQMIAMYRKEMMDLVRNVPEAEEEEERGGYELSLRDIVELPGRKQVGEHADVSAQKGRPEKEKRRDKTKREGTTTAKLLLKAFMPRFPAVFVGRKRVASGGAGKGVKVSPNHPLASNEESSNRQFGQRSRHNDRRRRGMTSCIVLFRRDP